MSGHTHIHTHIHTYTHTYIHDNYYNPRCAHAHRGLIIIVSNQYWNGYNLLPQRVSILREK